MASPQEKKNVIVLEKVLVATDFSESAGVALMYGKELAAAFGAELHVVHVYPGLNLDASADNELRGRLDKLMPPAERERCKAKLVVKVGTPFLEIVRYAKIEDVGLVVMGSHGHGPIMHMLIGSVTNKVVHRAPCPVLVVRHPEHEFVIPGVE
jgi:nucleotide-binding universal stress UspA family protein